MPKHMHREMNKLLERMLSLADIVQLRLKKAVDAVIDQDVSVAEEVIRGDDEIDQLEVDVEEECLKFLALYQPVASDLRLIVTVLKMNNDMERIGDIAANIAERAVFVAQHPDGSQLPLDLRDYASKVQNMLASSIRALMQNSPQLAREVCHMDREIDTTHADAYRIIGDCIVAEPQRVQYYLQVLSLSRYLERIADLATNIAEDVIYLVEGSITRHHDL